MNNPYPQTKPANKQRQIGRKVLRADQIARVLEQKKAPTKAARKWGLPAYRPKVLAGILVAVIAIGIAGAVSMQQYSEQQAAALRAEVIEERKALRARSSAADACRRVKAEQKASQIGSITYDELYDHGECDK